MKPKKLLALTICACCIMGLCACGDKDTGANVPPSSSPSGAQLGQNSSDPNPSSDVSFGLTPAPDPNFSDPYANNDNKLYTIVGDYAYELDPVTLQPTGDPLDPVTHMPVQNPVTDTENTLMDDNPQYNPNPEPSPSPSTKPDTSLPNTGMFLEDD